MWSGAGDHHEEELALYLWEVIAVHSLACGLADGGPMHHGTPYCIVVTLVL